MYMAERRQTPRVDTEGERVRAQRLRKDGRRSLSVNLEQTIALSRKLAELHNSMQRGR